EPMVPLEALECVEYRVRAPLMIPRTVPCGVVVRSASQVGHRVDGAAASEGSSLRQENPATIQAVLRNGLVRPTAWIRTTGQIGDQTNHRRSSSAPGLEQQHARLAILTQPEREDTGGGTAADDY